MYRASTQSTGRRSVNRLTPLAVAAAVFASIIVAGCSEDESPSPAPPPTAESTVEQPASTEPVPAQTAEIPEIGEEVPSGAYSELGVPIYSGARLIEEHTYRVTVQHQEGAVDMVELVLISNDDIERISAFYRGALPGRSTQIFALDGTDGRTISITTELPDQSSTNILLTEHTGEGATQIKVTHMSASDMTLGRP